MSDHGRPQDRFYHLSPAEMIEMASSGSPGDKSDLAIVPHLPVEAMILIATDPERFVRFSILSRREIPEAVIVAALTRFPLEATDFSSHWSAPPLLMESAPLAHIIDDALQGYFDHVGTTLEHQQAIAGLRHEAMKAGNEELTLGQARWIASQRFTSEAGR